VKKLNNKIKPIFIFSLPRSGSTLLQSILASHKKISTVSEPWILLPFLDAIRLEGTYSDYHHSNMVVGIRDFIKSIEKSGEQYNNILRKFILDLYCKASDKDSLYFIDKTPRYHIFADKIINLFPEGKFIFLWRDPLSIISSFINSYGKKRGSWNIYFYKIDLFNGLENLTNAYKNNTDKSLMVRYEDMICKPEKELKRIFSYLDLSFCSDSLYDFNKVKLKGREGDKEGIKKYNNLSKEPIEKWKDTLGNFIRKKWCIKYINWIGKNRLDLMGYDYNSIINKIRKLKNFNKLIIPDIKNIIFGIIYCFLEFHILKSKIKENNFFKKNIIHL
jgi:hypothetical protein